MKMSVLYLYTLGPFENCFDDKKKFAGQNDPVKIGPIQPEFAEEPPADHTVAFKRRSQMALLRSKIKDPGTL